MSARRTDSEARWPLVPVFYATTDGHTARIAARLALHLRERGVESEAFDVSSKVGREERDWQRVAGVILCASVHIGGHQRAARRFAARHRERLARVPSLFVSVCLAIRSRRQEDREAAERIADSFGAKTGWRADRTVCVAGCVAYTRYGWLVRLVMRRISAAEGGSTDTSRDHDYTDWEQVERLADEFSKRTAREPSNG